MCPLMSVSGVRSVQVLRLGGSWTTWNILWRLTVSGGAACFFLPRKPKSFCLFLFLTLVLEAGPSALWGGMDVKMCLDIEFP